MTTPPTNQAPDSPRRRPRRGHLAAPATPTSRDSEVLGTSEAGRPSEAQLPTTQVATDRQISQSHRQRTEKAAKRPRRQPKHPARLEPVMRPEIDSSLIGLAMWLLASRIVEEAEANGDLDCPDPSIHPEALAHEPIDPEQQIADTVSQPRSVADQDSQGEPRGEQ